MRDKRQKTGYEIQEMEDVDRETAEFIIVCVLFENKL